MDTFLATYYDFRKLDMRTPKSDFFQFLMRLILKYTIIYLGVMFFCFIYYQNTSYNPFFIIGLFVRGCPGMVGVHCYPPYPLSQYAWWEFFRFVFDISCGKWPDSYVFADGVSVLEVITNFYPRSLELLLYSSILTLVCGYCIGFRMAKGKWNGKIHFIDGFFRILAGIFLYIPLVGIFLQYTLAVKMDVLPAIGFKTPGFPDPIRITGLRLVDSLLTGQFGLCWDILKHLILPLFTLTSCGIGLMLRYFRNSFVHVFKQNYTQAALANGAKLDIKSIFNRNMSFYLILSCFHSSLLSLISMLILVENVFHLRGIGLLFIDAIKLRDTGVVIGVVYSLLVVIVYSQIGVAIIQYIINPVQYRTQFDSVPININPRERSLGEGHFNQE